MLMHEQCIYSSDIKQSNIHDNGSEHLQGSSSLSPPRSTSRAGDARNGDVAARSPERTESSIHAKEHSRQDVAADESEGIGPWKVSNARNRSVVVGDMVIFNELNAPKVH